MITQFTPSASKLCVILITPPVSTQARFWQFALGVMFALMHAKLLWIERGNGSSDLLFDLRRRKYQIATVGSGKHALELIHQMRPNLLVVNAASLRSSGTRLCYQLEQKKLPILLITSKELFRPATCADEILVYPFTIRKLVNRIRKLVGSGGRRLQTGPLVLDCEYHYLLSNGNRIELTPQACRLLQTLMEHPGKVLDRNFLYCTVWETDYTGDTRSLDVHISWIRSALGDENKNLLKTIRGVGYRLEV